jgi:HK97 family phage major capsid protein
MSINVRELSLLLKEYNGLTNKLRMSKADEQRCGYLQTAIAAVKAGASLTEVDIELFNERSRAAGMPTIEMPKSPSADEREAQAWQGFVNGEHRALTEGNTLAGQVGTYSGLGYFVPTGFFPELFRALKAHDALFDEDLVTLVKTTNGAPLPIPIADDTGHTASVVTEAGEQTSVDFDSTSHAVLGAFSYATDRYVCSIESFQDLSGAITMTGLAK